MRKLFLLPLLVFVSTMVCFAQDRTRAEIFAGYSYESMESGIKSSDFQGTGITRTSLDERFNLNGLNASVAGYVTRHFGIVGDFSAGFNSRRDSFDTIQTRSKLSVYNITGGPQVKFFSDRRAAPFLHALFGIARRRLKETAIAPTAASIASATDSSTSFAMNLGGGIDVRLSDRFDLRLIQVDYNPIFLRERIIEGEIFPGRTLNGVRISVGLVIKR